MKENYDTVLITGTSSGIGHKLALQFGTRAETLVLVARRLDRLEMLREELLGRYPGLKAVALVADLSDEHDIETLLGRVAEQAGPIDVLVNNAGLGDAALFDRSDWVRTRQILRTNIFAMTQLAWALVPGMVERRRGGVLKIGSGAGLAVMPNAAAYVGSKHFVAGFSEALRADLAGTGVTVTQVCPGPVDSEFDQVAGSIGGMAGAPPESFRISAAQCAREAFAGFERGDALVFPGRTYRFVMRVLRFVPMWLQRSQAAKTAARLRAAQTRGG
jgi:uncharacterized protein